MSPSASDDCITAPAAGDPARPTPPALFLMLDVPYGAAVGYVTIAVPFWLSRAGVSFEQIALIMAATLQALAWKLLWIPLLDLGSRRRAWYFAMALGTAALLVCASLVSAPARLGLYTSPRLAAVRSRTSSLHWRGISASRDVSSS